MFNILWKSAQSAESINLEKVHKSLNYYNGDSIFIRCKIAYGGRKLYEDTNETSTSAYRYKYSIISPDITHLTDRFKKLSNSDFIAENACVDESTMIFDKYGFEISAYANCYEFIPNLLNQNHDAIMQAITGDMGDLNLEYGVDEMFPDYDSDDEENDLTNGMFWLIKAIRFNDYVSPHGKNAAMLEYLTETIDEPGQPGCLSGWNKIQEKLKSS